jgi:hypothetical protein
VRKRERERERKREKERERERERERVRKRESEKEREKERERCRMCPEFLFLSLKGMTGALAHFSYLVSKDLVVNAMPWQCMSTLSKYSPIAYFLLLDKPVKISKTL